MAETPGSIRALSTSSTRRNAKRSKSFMLPDGKEVHIALSPEEAESLRQRLSAIKKDEPFDLVIHGSPEHIEHLRRAHSHHESRRASIQAKYADVYEEWERVRQDLDHLSNELHMISDHAVNLDVNFGKFGYDAHLKTYDEPTSSQSSTYGHDEDHEGKDWNAEKTKGKVFKLWKKPIVRQYFHKGLLWRASRSTEVNSFELFFDLLFVGIIAINGDSASEHATGEELLRYVITFILSWRIWSDVTVVVGWFEIDDIIQRFSILFIMACLIGFTTNMLEVFNDTYAQMIAFYLAARLSVALYFAFVSIIVPMVRGTMISHVILMVVGAVLWIGSIYVEMPNRLAIIWIAIAIDLFGSVLIVGTVRAGARIFPFFKDGIDKAFEFFPAVNIEHKVERTNAFVSLIFGYSVVAILYQNLASFGLNAFFGKAILGLMQAYFLNTIYFEIDGDSLFQHAIRRSVWSSFIWVSFHLPFLLAYSLSAGALSRLVLAHDCYNADVENLTETYAGRSEAEIHAGLRWFYCGGLSITLLSMALISFSHVHKSIEGIRITKFHRLANRVIVAIIILCLPLAHELNSLYLISVTTGLILEVTLVELYGASCSSESFFGDERQCKYTARCHVKRKDIEAAAKNGQMINVEEVAKHGEKGVYS